MDEIENGSSKLSRRAILLGLPLFLAGCAVQPGGLMTGDAGTYGSITDDGYTIPALDMSKVDPSLLRRRVPWHGPGRPGQIVVKVKERHLYLIEKGGTAMRYSVGVGRQEALNFRGTATIGRKARWPHWTPTANMMAKIPRYRSYAGGMKGGIGNPLGARALYLYRGHSDSHFRLHGTNEPSTIGTAVSSGCIRLFNHDIIDLYNRVPAGTTVTVYQG